MRILGIETSCDETAAAVLEWPGAGGARPVIANPAAGEMRPAVFGLRSSIVASQVDLHARYGGVVPELASRRHLERLGPVIDEALDRAATTLDRLDAIAVTCGPGLVGALAVGVAAAKSLALALEIRLIGVNHVEGHIYAAFLEHPDLALPAVVLVVSGAHTDLLVMRDHGAYEMLGRTRDDAAGEAFDKAARALGLGYPGGPAIEDAARPGRAGAVALPLPFPNEDSFDFSFSGLKTAVLRAVGATAPSGLNNIVARRVAGGQSQDVRPADSARIGSARRVRGAPPCNVSRWPQGHHDSEAGGDVAGGSVADIAAAFQDAVTRVLVDKTIRAARRRSARTIIVAGGVAANSLLRERMAGAAARAGIALVIPSRALCTDNAGMIAAAGAYRLDRGERSSLHLGAYADMDIMAPVPETLLGP